MNNRIKDVIKEQGYSITSLAEKMGMTRENLHRIINNPSSATLEKLSNELNVPVWQFFTTKQEIAKELGKGGYAITCPKCGTKFKVEITPEE